MKTIKFLRRLVKSLDAWLSKKEQALTLRYKLRINRHMHRIPRIWMLVGGKDVGSASQFISQLFPNAHEFDHDGYTKRWFVGEKCVAEAIPSPSGLGDRIFLNEKYSARHSAS